MSSTPEWCNLTPLRDGLFGDEQIAAEMAARKKKGKGSFQVAADGRKFAPWLDIGALSPFFELDTDGGLLRLLPLLTCLVRDSSHR